MEQGINQQIDKRTWSRGPWDTEQDYYRWTDSLTGFDMLVQRNVFSGSFNGYVGVPDTHLFYGRRYDAAVTISDELVDKTLARPYEPEDGSAPDVFGQLLRIIREDTSVQLSDTLQVHGGITFTGKRELGEEKLWYVGFDCGHFMDLQPGLLVHCSAAFQEMSLRESTYRTFNYVKGQCEKLAKQLLSYGSTN